MARAAPVGRPQGSTVCPRGRRACRRGWQRWLRSSTTWSSTTPTTCDAPLAAEVVAMRHLADRIEGVWLRRLAAYLRDLVDPEAAEERARARLDQRGLWLAGTFEGMVAVKGLLDPETGEATMAALAPLARPTGPDDERPRSNAAPTPSASWPAKPANPGSCPRVAGCGRS
jgi:Domain of unknown function (DUF222)